MLIIQVKLSPLFWWSLKFFLSVLPQPSYLTLEYSRSSELEVNCGVRAVIVAQCSGAALFKSARKQNRWHSNNGGQHIPKHVTMCAHTHRHKHTHVTERTTQNLNKK